MPLSKFQKLAKKIVKRDKELSDSLLEIEKLGPIKK